MDKTGADEPIMQTMSLLEVRLKRPGEQSILLCYVLDWRQIYTYINKHIHTCQFGDIYGLHNLVTILGRILLKYLIPLTITSKQSLETFV